MGCLKLTYHSHRTSLTILIGGRRCAQNFAGGYIFGFNGGEAIAEIYGDDNYVDLGERGVDTRLGRLNWTIDPKFKEYPWQSPYAYYANSPIWQIDYLGMGKQTHYVGEDGKTIANTQDGIDRTVTVKDEQRAGFEASMQMAERNNWTNSPTFNTILSDRIDQTNFNSTAQIRSNIGAVADSHIDETTWNKEVAKDNFPAGTWKCNKFVYDVLNEAGVKAPATSGGWPLTAGAWGDKNTFIQGWTVLSNNFQPQAGDIAAESHDYSDATGHTGIVSTFGQTTSATNSSVVRNDWGFRPDNKGVTVFRRYIGR